MEVLKSQSLSNESYVAVIVRPITVAVLSHVSFIANKSNHIMVATSNF